MGLAAATNVPQENILQLLTGAVVPPREDLEAYWRRVAKRALPYLGRRPLKLVRHVGGITFFHMGPLPLIPQSVHQLRIAKRGGAPGVRVWIDDLDGLLGLIDMDVIEIHPWGATVDDIDRPDVAVFDLDPGAGIDWRFVTDTALALRDVLTAEGFKPWVKTSGGKGFHIMVPLDRSRSWPKVRDWVRRVAAGFAARDARYILGAKDDREHHVFIDYLRNGRGSTAVGAFSPRARPRFPVSYPVTWADVESGIKADAWTMARVVGRTPVRAVAKHQPRPTVTARPSPAKGRKRAASAPVESSTPPAFVPPQLALLVDEPPEGDQWVHEVKWDGYRAELAIAGNQARFYTRKGLDWSKEYPALVAAAGRLACRSALVDGEAAVLNERGVPDFNLMERGDAVTYFAFDLLELDGRDLKGLPLRERKTLLKNLIDRSAAAAPIIQYSEHFATEGAKFFTAACGNNLEGIVSKRIDRPYRSGSRDDWRKTKCFKRQEFVVGGWLVRENDPKDLASLLVGYYDGKTLKYVGTVGTGKGLTVKARQKILDELAPLQTDRKPFDEVQPLNERTLRWAKPKMVVEVQFAGFTHAGFLRHESLIGIRRDKDARDVVLEVPRPTPAPGVIAKSKPRWRGRR